MPLVCLGYKPKTFCIFKYNTVMNRRHSAALALKEPEQEVSQAPNNRTIKLSEADVARLRRKSLKLTAPTSLENLENQVIQQDIYPVLDLLPEKFIDLAFIDPPYNLDKNFNGRKFKEMTQVDYKDWLDSWISKLIRLMKPNASLYICGDWRSAAAIFDVASKYFHIQNRITFEREKGRGAKNNWKNCSEDIWFCTMSKEYYFDVNAVMLKRKVLAPYRDDNGAPKDWSSEGSNKYRVTYPSNLWTDLTIPFWSMPENTDHPTQKPEKLLAKIILASSCANDMVFDPFLGSGTTAIVAKKLGRKFLGVEVDEGYCCLAHKRLEISENDSRIQGYEEGFFWERNSSKPNDKPEKGQADKGNSLDLWRQHK